MFRTGRPPFASVREVAALLWREASSFVKARLSLAVLLLVVASAMAPLGPVALKMIVDRLADNVAWPMPSITLLVALYALSQWLPRCVAEVRGWIYARAERRLYRTVSERLFAHVMRLPMRYHLERQTGAVSQTIDNGLQGVQMVLNTLVFTFLPLLVQFATVAIVLQQLGQPVFLALLAGAAICYAIVFRFFGVRLVGAARNASTAQVDAKAVMTDSLLNYETVKFFAAESVVEKKLGRAFAHTEDAWVSFFRHAALNGLTIATIFGAFLAAGLVYAAQQVRVGHMTVGDFVLISAYMLQFMAPLELLGRAVQGLGQGLATLERMMALLREQPEPQQTESAALAGAGRLEFERVSLSYRSDRSVLRDVSFRIPAGQTLGIVGASGAGKSTLIRLLVRLFEPDSGAILLDGVPTTRLSLAQLRRAIAVVPQDTVLFNDSIRYNIAFGKAGSTPEEIEEAARVAHLHDFIMSLPEKYDTQVGERGVKLSGGEKQRVSIARAAIKHPRIYVFDEATSSLDSRTEQEILANLREISRTCTTLIIAHRLSTVVHADEIVVLDDGTIAERGTHEALVGRKGRYAALWQAQQLRSDAEAPLSR